MWPRLEAFSPSVGGDGKTDSQMIVYARREISPVGTVFRLAHVAVQRRCGDGGEGGAARGTLRYLHSERGMQCRRLLPVGSRDM